MQELQIISEILSAKPDNAKLENFNKYLENFYEVSKKIAVENEIDLLLKLKAIESEIAVISAYPELFSKHVIAVGGGFSAGKSAFVNSFLKSKDIQLPISIDPTTAIPSYVMSSPKDEIIGISKNNGVANLGKIAPDILSRLTHNADNRLDFSFNLKDILPFMVVSTEFSDDKYKKICFIDTPGYDPNSSGNQAQDFNTAKVKLAPDDNAYIRAKIQQNYQDNQERSSVDVLMQSTFMQVGSQQSYNSLTDKRTGKFNQNDKGLIEFEKTFTESVVFDKNILSVTYQTVDENARLVGYETDLGTMKRHIVQALDMGENVIIGYTQTDNNNIIINGHEITIIGYKTDNKGKMTFICNDTDDNISKPIEYTEDYLLPKIHHAALPQEIVEKDLNIVPNWIEGIQMYKEMKREAEQQRFAQQPQVA